MANTLAQRIPVGDRDWFSVREAAEIAQVTRDTVLAWIHRGAIVPTEVGGRMLQRLPATFISLYRIAKNDFAAFLQLLRTPGGTVPPTPSAAEQRRRADQEMREAEAALR